MTVGCVTEAAHKQRLLAGGLSSSHAARRKRQWSVCQAGRERAVLLEHPVTLGGPCVWPRDARHETALSEQACGAASW
jgi:hypothetical protein